MHHHIEYLTRTPTGLTTVVTHTSVIDVQHVINDIASGCATYTAGTDVRNLAHVKTIPFLSGAYLYANWDGTKRNNLHDVALPTRENAPPTGKARSAAHTTTVLPFVLKTIRSIACQGRIRGSDPSHIG